MKGFVKKIKNGLKIGVAGILLAGTVMTGAAAYSNIELSEYSTDQEIEMIAENLNCDLSYAAKYGEHYHIMKHNGNEPIYVCFDENLTEEEKKVVTEATDYVFNIVSVINQNYRYEIVDKTTYNLNFSKTRIYVKEGDCENINNFGDVQYSQGYAKWNISLLSQLTQKRVTKDHKVELNRDKIENADELYSTAVHELLHHFGFGDVYTDAKNKTTDKYYGNTFMKPDSEAANKLLMITPNDLKVLVSLYLTEESNKEKVDKMIKDYDQKFYAIYSNKCKSSVKTEESIIEDEFKIIDNLWITDLDGTKSGYIYEITIESDMFKFEIFDILTNQKLESSSGEITKVNGTIVLKNVEFKKGLRPYDPSYVYEGGIVRDLILLSKDGKIGWYDINSNDFRPYGTVESLEKDMGL